MMTKERECLDFIRYVLNPEEEMLKDMAKMDWEGLFRFASEHAILGVVFEGVKRLGEQGVKPPFQLLVRWVAIAEQIERRNRMVNRAAVRLVAQLREDGLECCILKGQGNCLMYPNVYARTPGDIDVWVKIADGRRKMADERGVIRYVKERNPKTRAVYHHIDGSEIDGIDVEVHYRPSFMNNPIHNLRLQKWFEQKASEQFSHNVELPDRAGEICVPTHEFNVVYQLVHIYRHLLQEGIGLRQIIDYFYLLRKAKDELTIENGVLIITLRHLGLWKIARAVMWVLSEVLGLDEKYLIAPKDERLGKMLLSEILNGGNFGQYDIDNIKADSQLKKNWQRIRRDIRMMCYFPSECLWEPLFRWYHFFWRLRHR